MKKISGFIPPSGDETLKNTAFENSLTYYASTSSITQILQILQLSFVPTWRLNTTHFSPAFKFHTNKFTNSIKNVYSIDLNYDPKLNTYGIDNGGLSKSTVLTDIGQSLEKFLTTTPLEYQKYLTNSLDQTTNSVNNLSYHYAISNGILLRAQLDCVNSDLPKKSFDLKTRAVAALRFTLDVGYSKRYKIKQEKGYFESFEREDYDLLRTALLKYCLQSRIGNMDGILVAYHNTFNIFGFQYFSQDKLDEWIYGNSQAAKVCFNLSLKMFKLILDESISLFPKQSIKIYYVKAAGQETHFAIRSLNNSNPNQIKLQKLKVTQMRGNKLISDAISDWKDFSTMSMDVSWEELSKKVGDGIIQRHDQNSDITMKFPSSFFRESYKGFLSKQ